eukprot:CAMPEP_0113514310 /NCGR_PEP_ID=MMETSP0014_2-20120614/40334_1 /TAXON_ID=2857 /ORGANISM="Nitzschia sp." /LENGTH=1283 /DNA_ID=CAMNT_0000410785 /DNA_START=116 /DNA_END=3967 /DNA_ORIENTATION=+ /assembly_acc=CAM_ASM_000159
MTMMLFPRLLLLAIASVVAVVLFASDAAEATTDHCPTTKVLEMGCYKCGTQLDCIIDDSGMVLTDPEQEEIVRLMFADGGFCTSGGKTVNGNQQGCNDEDLEIAFKSNHMDCCMPPPVFSDMNRCPISGENALSNFAAYTITVTPSSVCAGCDPSSEVLVAGHGKCEAGQGCTCKEGTCDHLGHGCANPDGKQCHDAKVPLPLVAATAEECAASVEEELLPVAISAPVEEEDEPAPEPEPCAVPETIESMPCPLVDPVIDGMSFNVSCYKCSTNLDCIIDDTASPVTDTSMQMEIVRSMEGGLCTLHQNGNMVTVAGQQGCDMAKYGFASSLACADYPTGYVPPAVLGDSNVCPISGVNGVSNHARYTVNTFPSGMYSTDCCPEVDATVALWHEKCDHCGCDCAFCALPGEVPGYPSPSGGYVTAVVPMTPDMKLTCPTPPEEEPIDPEFEVLTAPEDPTLPPTAPPTESPTEPPTAPPTSAPTASPTGAPTSSPTSVPTEPPTEPPVADDTAPPTAEPTKEPTSAPTDPPTDPPVEDPTAPPTNPPTDPPVADPTAEPTKEPTKEPTAAPTDPPTDPPVVDPTAPPTAEPTKEPTAAPTSVEPTKEPTPPPTTGVVEPKIEVLEAPTTVAPTQEPTAVPTASPTDPPTEPPVDSPTEPPVDSPTEPPVDSPTEPPVDSPTEPPLDSPTEPPVDSPTEPPVDSPTEPPVDSPTEPPSSTPSATPSAAPSVSMSPTDCYMLPQANLESTVTTSEASAASFEAEKHVTVTDISDGFVTFTVNNLETTTEPFIATKYLQSATQEVCQKEYGVAPGKSTTEYTAVCEGTGDEMSATVQVLMYTGEDSGLNTEMCDDCNLPSSGEFAAFTVSIPCSVQSVECVEPVEAPTDAPETTGPPTDPTDAPADPTDPPTDPTEAPAPTDPTEAPAPTDPTDAPAPTDPTDAPAPTDPTEAPAPTDPTEAPAPTDPTDAPAPTDPTDAPAPTDPTEAPAPTDPTEAPAPTDPTDAPAPTDPTDAPAPTDPTDAPAPTDPTDAPAPTDPTDAPAPTDPTDAPAPTDPTDAPAPTDPTDAPAPTDPTDAPVEEPDIVSISAPVDECVPDYLTGTAADVCPPGTESIVQVRSAVDSVAGGPSANLDPAQFIYDIQFIPADSATGAPQQVSFKVDNPLDSAADVYVDYSKPADSLGYEPECEAFPMQQACQPPATTITAVCHVNSPYTLVNIYIASTDAFLAAIGQAAEVKTCCLPPDLKDGYNPEYGVVRYAVVIRCECPDVATTRKKRNLRGKKSV